MIYPRKALRILKASLQYRVIVLDYPWRGKSRYDQEKPISADTQKLCENNIPHSDQLITEMIAFKSDFSRIPLKSKLPNEIFWLNNFLPGQDIISLYTLINILNPSTIIEIGSGHSTAVMRTAIKAHHLQSNIICIDPQPRREISSLADQWVQSAVEDLDDFSLFRQLRPGDIVFFDGSHIALANTDVTVFFLEILPLIPSGVYVQIHDVNLPYDYPEDMVQRGYNEQYFLSLLLTNSEKYEIVFPGYFTFRRKESRLRLEEYLWNELDGKNEIEKHGGSFWFKIKG